jgi:dTDP-glucose 4,6-dehydratase
MNILVTGAAGFIGRNFAYGCFSEDVNLFLVDKISSASSTTSWKHFEFISAIEQSSIKDVVTSDISYISSKYLEDNEITHVVNFAAESHVDRSIANPVHFTMSNAVSTHLLLEECRKYGKLEKFIQVSTDEVYGSLLAHEAPFTEQSPLKPSSPYSASKLAQDVIAMAYYHTYGLPVCITRCSNNYGYGQNEEKLIPKVIQQILSNKPITIYGDGSNVRDWIHVDDHCDGINLVIEKGVPGNVYNLGGNNELSNIEIVHKILKIYEEITGEDRSNLVTFVKDRLGHDQRYAIDNSFAKKELGFNPSVDFNDGLFGCVDGYIYEKYSV